MKEELNEIKRMQKLAGLVNEDMATGFRQSLGVKNQSIVYQIVEDLPKELNESIEEETVNVVDSIPELQKKLRDLAVNLPKIKGIDVAEVKNLNALIDAITSKLGKGSIGIHQKAALDVFNRRTQGLN